VLPVSEAAPPHKSVLVGDLKLADIKQFLSSKGVQVLTILVSNSSLLQSSVVDFISLADMLIVVLLKEIHHF